ncbi:unnamed protein product [Mytilus edulis]|uniref:C-type lectin domain-containing protein n=1 Tax=Mytilus edulis TaxID=6550 RepID=A0A8S3RIB6_MYTED|nr:unnamed protein product [Mytilus edulis]
MVINIAYYFLLLGLSEFTSESKLTWMDAQLFCSKRNSFLIRGQSQYVRGKYWTGEYERLSRWMHIIGCYSLNYLEDNTDIRRRLPLPAPSLGLCQESCLPVNVFAFSIQNNMCLCLGKIPEKNGLSPKKCDGKCREIKQHDIDSFPNDCGSTKHTNIFNVYATSPIRMKNENGNYITSKLCVFLWTTDSPDKYEFIPMNCDNVLHGGICQEKKDKNEFVKLKEYGTWRDSLDRCKRDMDSYLYGNISTIIEAEKMINRSTFQGKTSLWHWIGVARQIYLSSDTGISIDTKSVIQCKKCHGSRCYFTSDCDNQNEQLLAVCSSDQIVNQNPPKMVGVFTNPCCIETRRKGMKAENDSASTNHSSQYTNGPRNIHSLKAIITSKLSFWNDTPNCQDNLSDVSSVVTVVNLFKNRSY